MQSRRINASSLIILKYRARSSISASSGNV